MSISISLSAEAESKLRRRAAVEGKDPAACASQIVEQAVRRPSVEELLAPLREEFAASGTTDEQLIEQIIQARDAYRNQR
jgi:hypothetical protein